MLGLQSSLGLDVSLMLVRRERLLLGRLVRFLLLKACLSHLIAKQAKEDAHFT